MLRSSAALVLLLAWNTPALAQDTAEHEAIRQTALDYVEGWYAGDAERMSRALHPELAKRILKVDAKTGQAKLEHMGAQQLIDGTKAGYGTKTPEAERQRDVLVLDVFGNAASAKAVMSGWVDYMHLAKHDGRWVIVNVLWELKPKQP